MKTSKLFSIIAISLLTSSITQAAEKWTEANVTKLPLNKMICNEVTDGGHGGYFVSFPTDPVTNYMIVGLDKSDDTEHLISGYDIRADIEGVNEVTRDIHVKGKWVEQKVKVLTIASNMGGVKTEIELKPLLKSLNSADPTEVDFPAELTIPTGNIQSFEMKCSFRN